MEDFLSGKLPKNLHITYSYTPERKAIAIKFLNLGGNVAIAFNTTHKVYQGTWKGFPIKSGDVDELRFLDPKGYVIALTKKGYATDNYKFFVDTDEIKK